MTDQNRLDIEKLRTEGFGPKKIALTLGLNPNTVKSYIRKIEKEKPKTICKNCGRPLIHPDRKTACFCSKKCSKAWWNEHRHIHRTKNIIEHECQQCHKTFLAPKSQQRKYCSRSCYMEARFHGE